MILVGQIDRFDAVARLCLKSGVFQPENRARTAGGKLTLTNIEDADPYTKTLQDLQKALDFAGITPQYRDFSDYSGTEEDLMASVQAFETEVLSLQQKIEEKKKEIDAERFIISQLTPLKDLDLPLEELFSFRYVSPRFGRMPRVSYDKIMQHGLPENTFIVTTTVDKKTVWCFYFCPRSIRTRIDAYFNALFFQREEFSEEAYGIPAQVIEERSRRVSETEKEIDALSEEYQKVIAAHREQLLTAYSYYRFLSDAFALRKYAGRDAHLFYLYGWVPTRDARAFKELMRDVDNITVLSEDPSTDKSLRPPTKIRNPWGINFFEQFVNMYGTPEYNEIDPTFLVALTYTLFFGIMFGDIGQGIVLLLAGLFAWFKLKMPLGKIMAVIGISSTCFGFFYGSLFGNEEIIKGFSYHVLEGDNTVFTLLFAAGVGVLLIVGAMLLNIVNGIRQRDPQKIFFDTNGLAGLVLFGGNIAALLVTFLAHKKVYSPLTVILLIVLPIILIFLRGPLGKLCAGDPHWKPEKFGEYCMENLFELIEVFLSFLSNTISYVRIGAFAVSHAGMMLVVVSMSRMVGGTGGVIVMVLGNILVIGLEGLIVGIQGLRLQFYEFFSRFYKGEGRPYTPLKANFDEK